MTHVVVAAMLLAAACSSTSSSSPSDAGPVTGAGDGGVTGVDAGADGAGTCSVMLDPSAFTAPCAACMEASCCGAITACADDSGCAGAGCLIQAPISATTVCSAPWVAVDACLGDACSDACQSCESGTNNCIRCSPETTDDDTPATATQLGTIHDCGPQYVFNDLSNTPTDVDWTTYDASTDDFCGVPVIEPHAQIYAVIPASPTQICVFVKRNDGQPTNGCQSGTPSDELAAMGFDGCCDPYQVRFNNYAVVSPGYDNGATVYMKVSRPGTDVSCAEYDATYGYGQFGN